jgi:hypothetical protein
VRAETLFLGSLKRLVSGRQRGQGLVEYGLIAACLAFVGIAGFNALADAQRGYLATFPRNAVPPSAPGALQHPTSIDLPACVPPGPTIKVGTSITCTATVHDIYVSNPPDPKPPWGTIYFLLDGGILNICALPHINTGSANSCSLTWKPVNSDVGNHTLVVAYMMPESNHLVGSPSTPLPLKLVYNVIWTTPPTCVNEVAPGLPTGQVEIGHPFNCSAKILDGSLSGNPPFANRPISWSTLNGPGQTGVGIFTCAGNYAQIWSSMCPPPSYTGPTTSFTCTTDTSGTCSVIYRRIYDSNLQGVNNALPLTVAALDAVLGDVKSYAVRIVPQIASDSVHPSAVVALCTDPADSGAPQNGPMPFGNVPAQFQGTHDIDVTGGTGSASISCTATVYDASANNPAADTAAIPNKDEAHPPLGMVTFKYFDGSSSTTVVATCPLVRSDLAGPPPLQQASGQAPFVSTCTRVFPLSGPVSPPPGIQPSITVEYETEIGALGGAAHGASTSTINVNFS